MPPRLSDLVVLAVAVAGSASAAVDLWTRRVPNGLVLTLTALGLLFALWHSGAPGLASAIAGFAVGFLLMLPGHLVGATGAGDVKLFAAMGTLVGPVFIAVAFVYTALAGGAIAVAVAMRRRMLRTAVERTAELVLSRGANVTDIESVTADNRFAYAPAIAIGTLAAALGM